MKRNRFVSLALLFCLVFGLRGGSIHAHELTRGGGGELPNPFDTANRRVELADGEPYLLVGRVVMRDGAMFGDDPGMAPYFRIDLTEQPWLATEKRVGQPYYPLEGSVDDWNRYVSMGKIKFPCVARVVIKMFGSRPIYSIHLQASTDVPVEPLLLNRVSKP